MARKPSDQDGHWLRRLSRSGYFFGALFLHVVLFVMIATWIIFPRFTPPDDDFTKTYLPPASVPPPPTASAPTMPVPTRVIPNHTEVINSNNATPAFTIPLPNLNPTSPTAKSNSTMASVATQSLPGLAGRLTGIKAMVESWRDGSNIRDANGDPHNVKATFPVYVAQYADGDWNCNIAVKNDAIVAGSIPNLVDKINEWSHGNIKGKVVPEPLNIGGPQLSSKKPPFIFFTGHKDFTLTSQEIENLRNYLQNGGAIWGDNALAGEGSRFDVAFRREMKRVIPDPDKNFEPLLLTHDVFTKSWFQISKMPQGMNYYAEPIQHIDLDGKLAIIYTPNDYSDLMFVHVLPGDIQVDLTNPPKYPPLFTNTWTYDNRGVFFRNLSLQSAIAADQLGMNIIGFLLVRFDADLLLTP